MAWLELLVVAVVIGVFALALVWAVRGRANNPGSSSRATGKPGEDTRRE